MHDDHAVPAFIGRGQMEATKLSNSLVVQCDRQPIGNVLDRRIHSDHIHDDLLWCGSIKEAQDHERLATRIAQRRGSTAQYVFVAAHDPLRMAISPGLLRVRGNEKGRPSREVSSGAVDQVGCEQYQRKGMSVTLLR